MANTQNTRSIFNFPLVMINKPSAPEDRQIKNWTNREGADRGKKGKTTRGVEERGAKLLMTNMAATTLRTSAAEDLRHVGTLWKGIVDKSDREFFAS